MTLYLLSIPDYDGDHILGVYSTREKAIASFPFQDEEVDESNISEIEVDPPNGPDFHEKFCWFCVCTDGDSWDGTTRMTEQKANQFPFLSFDSMRNRYSSLAYARTPEEAEAKARHGLTLLDPVWQVGRAINTNGIIEAHHAHKNHMRKWELLEGNTGYAFHKDLETARNILLTYEQTGVILPGLVLPLNATTPKESDPQ